MEIQIRENESAEAEGILERLIKHPIKNLGDMAEEDIAAVSVEIQGSINRIPGSSIGEYVRELIEAGYEELIPVEYLTTL